MSRKPVCPCWRHSNCGRIRLAERRCLSPERSDPLYHTAKPIASLGFVEGYPINPRHAPQHEIDWGVTMLLRHADPVLWRHHYDVDEVRAPDSVVLGGLWTRPAASLLPLHLGTDGRLISDLLPDGSMRRRRLSAKLRWAAAPLGWPDGRPQGWAARAAAGRARMLLVGNSHKNLSSAFAETEILVGYLGRDPSPGWSPLFSATHPALADQYVTRSELEATDMGYKIDGILGYIIDRFADRSRDALPSEVKWASHFGHRRRYVEGFRP